MDERTEISHENPLGNEIGTTVNEGAKQKKKKGPATIIFAVVLVAILAFVLFPKGISLDKAIENADNQMLLSSRLDGYIIDYGYDDTTYVVQAKLDQSYCYREYGTNTLGKATVYRLDQSWEEVVGDYLSSIKKDLVKIFDECERPVKVTVVYIDMNGNISQIK